MNSIVFIVFIVFIASIVFIAYIVFIVSITSIVSIVFIASIVYIVSIVSISTKFADAWRPWMPKRRDALHRATPVERAFDGVGARKMAPEQCSTVGCAFVRETLLARDALESHNSRVWRPRAWRYPSAPPDAETLSCTTVESHQANVLLTGFADGSEMRGSSTRYLEMTPVFPGSRTLFFANL